MVHGLIDQGDYVSRESHFESFPGFFVQYNISQETSIHPAVLCPRSLENGPFLILWRERANRLCRAERFVHGQARRQNPLVRELTGIGLPGVSTMIRSATPIVSNFPLELAHRFEKHWTRMNDLENWGLFSPQAGRSAPIHHGAANLELDPRKLDFVASFCSKSIRTASPVISASGGGTQSHPRHFLIRICPVVSRRLDRHAGGCTCENVSCLRRRHRQCGVRRPVRPAGSA